MRMYPADQDYSKDYDWEHNYDFERFRLLSLISCLYHSLEMYTVWHEILREYIFAD